MSPQSANASLRNSKLILHTFSNFLLCHSLILVWLFVSDLFASVLIDVRNMGTRLGCPTTWCIFTSVICRKQVLVFSVQWDLFLIWIPNIQVCPTSHLFSHTTSHWRQPPLYQWQLPWNLVCHRHYFCIHRVHFILDLTSLFQAKLVPVHRHVHRKVQILQLLTLPTPHSYFLFQFELELSPQVPQSWYIFFLERIHIIAILGWIFNRLAIFNAVVLSPFKLSTSQIGHTW